MHNRHNGWHLIYLSSALQQIVTHRNTLQHTVTHDNTLQRTATHCITLIYLYITGMTPGISSVSLAAASDTSRPADMVCMCGWVGVCVHVCASVSV